MRQREQNFIFGNDSKIKFAKQKRNSSRVGREREQNIGLGRVLFVAQFVKRSLLPPEVQT